MSGRAAPRASTGPADAPRARARRTRSARRCAMWDAAGPRRSPARFRVIRYDHRGHGGSPVPAGPVRDRRRSAATCSRCWTGSGSSARSFCGLSLGGMAGMWLGVQRARAHRPARAAAAPRRTCRRASCGASARRPCARQGTEAVADAGVERWFTPEFAAPTRRGRRAARRCSPRRRPRATPAAARRSAAWTCAATLGRDRGADARDRRRRGPVDAARARPRDRRRDPRRALRGARGRPRTSRTSSAPSEVTDLIARAPRPDRRTDERPRYDAGMKVAPRGARRRARRPRDRATRPTSPRRSRSSSPATPWGEVWTRDRASTAARAARSRSPC